MRLLLLKQDQVSILEKQLDELDDNESMELFLGNCRRDGNMERKATIQSLESHLAEYGESFKRA